MKLFLVVLEFAFFWISLLTSHVRASDATKKAPALRGQKEARELGGGGSVLCRMILQDIMFLGADEESEKEQDEFEFTSQEETACAVLVNDGTVPTERASLIPLTLPADLANAHADDLRQGKLVVEITDAQVLVNDAESSSSSGDHSMKITVQPWSTFVVISPAEDSILKAQQLPSAMVGTRTVAVVRIETSLGASPQASASDLAAMMDSDQINFRTQFQRCSAGQLKFVPSSHGFVHSVRLNGTVAAASSPEPLIDQASEQLMADLGFESMQELADHVLFCLPPGTGSWVAAGGRNHWRSIYNSRFCTSLSAIVHELGHNLGLPHANRPGGIKYGDTTGYMARSYRNKDYPLRCFNGRNSHYLGWYASKTKKMSGKSRAKLIELGSIVHYNDDKDAADYVLVNLDDKLLLMYNLAADFTQGTGSWRDSLTITEDVDGGSELLAGLRPGEKFIYGDGVTNSIIIEACKRVHNDDRMIVSVGHGASRCQEVAENNDGPPPTITPALQPPPTEFLGGGDPYYSSAASANKFLAGPSPPTPSPMSIPAPAPPPAPADNPSAASSRTSGSNGAGVGGDPYYSSAASANQFSHSNGGGGGSRHRTLRQQQMPRQHPATLPN